MSTFIRTLSLLLVVGIYGTTSAMFLTKSRSLALKKAAMKKMAQPKQYSHTTIQPIMKPPTSDITWLDKIKTWLFKPTEEPILLQQINPQNLQSAPKSATLMHIPPQPSTKSIDTVQSLPEVKKLLLAQENIERNKQKIIFNIAPAQWQDLLNKTQQRINWINNNCFTKHHPDAIHDNNIPKTIYNRIAFFLNKAHIKPSSINIRYQNTTHIDPFGHKVISTEAPILEYALSPTLESSAIIGYKPATITLHSQIVSTLSPNELDAELQHAITHLTRGHNEQLKILENTIGTKQYENYIQSPEGKQFIASLETTADLLEPTKDPAIAKIVQKAFLEKAFDYALKTIKESRKKHGIENSETGLMVCTPPGTELKFLAELQSFEDIENDFKAERKKILHQAGVNNDEIQAFEDEIKNSKEYLEKNYYQTPIDGIFHDPTFAPETLKEIKTLLHNAGINPFSVEIINQTRKEMDGAIASAVGPLTIKKKDKPIEMAKNQTAKLYFCQEIINANKKEYIAWVISHEIGHLIRDHTNRTDSAHRVINKAFQNNKKNLYANEGPPFHFIMNRAREKLDTLNELEADTTYLMRNFNLAKIAHNEFLRIIATTKKTNEWLSPIHMSINNTFHWSNKILQLHAKEKEKNQEIPLGFSPNNNANLIKKIKELNEQIKTSSEKE